MNQSKWILCVMLLVHINVTHCMIIFVKTLRDKTLRLDVAADDTVESVKQQITTKENIPTKDQRLIFQGEELENAKMLKDYKVQDEATLHLVTKRKLNSSVA